jgi:hypothetical protein
MTDQAISLLDINNPTEELHTKLAQLRQIIYDDPEFFVAEILGIEYWSKQIEIIEGVRNHRRLAVSGCTASGKTIGAAMAMLWWLTVYNPGRVITLAPSTRQVEMNIWGYAKSFHANAKIPLGGDFQVMNWKFRREDGENDSAHYAIGFSTDEAERVRGIHGPRDLILLDDAQGIMQIIMDGLRNAMAGGSAHIAMFYNKTKISGETYEAHTTKRGKYHLIEIPASATPNVRFGETRIQGMITKEFVDESIEEYGENSNYCLPMIFDKFPKSEPDTLIPIDWIDDAMRMEAKTSKDKDIDFGLDVAREGDDTTVLTPIRGFECLRQIETRDKDGVEVAEWTLPIVEKMNGHSVGVDYIGFGSSAYDQLRRMMPGRVIKINSSQKSSDKEKYFNLRSEIAWIGRESLNPKNPHRLKLQMDRELAAQLSNIKFDTETGRIRVESKDDIKARAHGKSPDKADSYFYAVYTKFLRRTSKNARLITTGEVDDDEAPPEFFNDGA